MKDLYGIAEFTEEEVSVMTTELEKYGIQLPQFNKIGGILANELSVDEAELHAAVIAINEALEAGDAETTIAKLLNPSACLEAVTEDNAKVYQERLMAKKVEKVNAAKNKIQNKGENGVENGDERDVYEELLTHAELQGNLNKINYDVKIETFNSAVKGCDTDEKILQLLQDLGINNVHQNNAAWYRKQAAQDISDKQKETESEDVSLNKEEIQNCVNTANKSATKHKIKKDVAITVNGLLSD
jgi:hypothetical protein